MTLSAIHRTIYPGGRRSPGPNPASLGRAAVLAALWAWLVLGLSGCTQAPTAPESQRGGTQALLNQIAWPDDPDVYFTRPPGAVDIAMANLVPKRARPDGIARAELFMGWLALSIEGKKREPISVRPQDDGRYLVLDGNSTYGVAKKRGLTRLRALVYPAGEEPPGKKTKAALEARAERDLKAAIEAGEFSGTLTKHLKIAKAAIKGQKAQFVSTINELQSLFPNAVVIGRVKTLDSAIGKLIRSSHEMRDATDLYDVTGTRVITRSLDDVWKAAELLRGRYDVVRERDYLTKPLGGYRAYHFRVRWPDGYLKEIQVMTRNQHSFAVLGHDAYKPINAAQEAALANDKGTIQGYFARLSQFFWSSDNGRAETLPSCPEIVRKAFECFNEASRAAWAR